MTYRDPESYKPERQHDGGTLPSLFDQVDVTLAKHGGNKASNDTNLRISASKRDICAQILKFAVMNGSHGITFKEVCSHLGLQPQTASARLSEMKRDGALTVKGDVRREDCSVLIPVYANEGAK